MHASASPKKEHHQQLARRLIIYILLFSSLITLLGTAFQLYSEFKRDIRMIHGGLEQIERSHLQPLIASVWVHDVGNLNMHLNGILEFPDIRYAAIETDEGVKVEAGKLPEGRTTQRRFELTRNHRGQPLHLGTLSVIASLEGVYQRLIDRVTIILATQAIKTFLVTIFIFIIFYALVGRHLKSLAAQTASLDMHTLDKALVLERKASASRKDELDRVVEALNEMRTRMLDGLIELKNSEASIRESEAKFRQLAENIAEVFWLGSPDWQEIYYVSPAYETIWGNARENLYRNPMTWIDSIHKKDLETVKTLFPIQWTTPLTPFVFPEYRIIRPDGSQRWILARAFPIANEEGDVWRVAGIAEDITTRKEAELKIKEMYRLLMGVTEGTTDAIFIKDLEGRYILANSAACRALGKTRDEVIGSTDQDLFPKASYKVIDAIDSQVLRNGQPLIAEEQLRTIDGDTIWLTNKSPQRDDRGDIIGIIGISRDITGIKKTEQEKEQLEHRLVQAQKMESIGNLAGGIAHDFNNLLFPIIGMAELLIQDLPENSRESKNARMILEAGKRGGELVKQILAFSRQAEQERIPTRIQQVLKEALKLIRSTIPSNIEISQDIQADCGSVMADPIQLHQVAMNLVTNAYHALEGNGGRIHIELKEIYLKRDDVASASLKTGRHARLKIADTGSGIAPEIRSKIFDPYFTTKGKGKGTGLGLAVVYGIIKKYEGEIQVDSEPGKGSTFIITIPVQARSRDRRFEVQKERLPSGKERILLVDDDSSVVDLEKFMLERLGYQVVSYTDCLEALKTFQKAPDTFDLIITDMTMPKMTGDLLANRLLAVRPDIPIIICTGYSDRVDESSVGALGVKGFLMKPVVLSDLAEKIRSMLDEAQGANRK